MRPSFPRAEKLYLKAIDETVPAYRSHFRLTRDITIPPENKLKSAVNGSGHFTVDGSLALSGLRRSRLLHPADFAFAMGVRESPAYPLRFISRNGQCRLLVYYFLAGPQQRP